MTTSKIFTVANIEDELIKDWLQHLRDFDTAHPGCHFEVCIDGPHIPIAEMIEQLRVNPKLTFTKIFSREQGEGSAADFVEQPDFMYFLCPDCDFDSIQRADFRGNNFCPLCAGDNGRDVEMRSRVARDTDRVEGRDARKE